MHAQKQLDYWAETVSTEDRGEGEGTEAHQGNT